MTTSHLLLLLLLLHLGCSEALQQKRFHQLSIALKIIKRLRTRVQDLLLHYKREALGDSAFEDRGTLLKSLPSSSTQYLHWLHIQDQERLTTAARDLRSFWAHLEVTRRHMKNERSTGTSRLVRAMRKVQLDMQDLLRLNLQLAGVAALDLTANVPVPHPTNSWHRHLQGYIVLRDLQRYLSKLFRDFTLLSVRHKG